MLHHSFKVDAPKSNIIVTWVPKCECHVVRFGSKEGYQKDMFLKDNGLCGQNMLTILV